MKIRKNSWLEKIVRKTERKIGVRGEGMKAKGKTWDRGE